jgi:hypothetical protein
LRGFVGLQRLTVAARIIPSSHNLSNSRIRLLSTETRDTADNDTFRCRRHRDESRATRVTGAVDKGLLRRGVEGTEKAVSRAIKRRPSVETCGHPDCRCQPSRTRPRDPRPKCTRTPPPNAPRTSGLRASVCLTERNWHNPLAASVVNADAGFRAVNNYRCGSDRSRELCGGVVCRGPTFDSVLTADVPHVLPQSNLHFLSSWSHI